MSEGLPRFITNIDGLRGIRTEAVRLPDTIRSQTTAWCTGEGFIIDGDQDTGLTPDTIDTALLDACTETDCHFLDARREGENYRIAVRYDAAAERLNVCYRRVDTANSGYTPWQIVI